MFGWKTILFFAGSEDPDTQVATNILIANLAVNEENQMQMIAVGGLKVLIDQATKTSGIIHISISFYLLILFLIILARTQFSFISLFIIIILYIIVIIVCRH